MYILFTKSTLIGSKLICAITGEPVSHCALQWGELVIHSSFSGITWTYLADFQESHEIVYKVKIDVDICKLASIKGQYDYGAFAYLALRLLLKKINIKLPKRNLWQTTGMYLCTEFISALLKEEDSMITPYKLYLKLREEK